MVKKAGEAGPEGIAANGQHNAGSKSAMKIAFECCDPAGPACLMLMRNKIFG